MADKNIVSLTIVFKSGRVFVSHYKTIELLESLLNAYSKCIAGNSSSVGYALQSGSFYMTIDLRDVSAIHIEPTEDELA